MENKRNHKPPRALKRAFRSLPPAGAASDDRVRRDEDQTDPRQTFFLTAVINKDNDCLIGLTRGSQCFYTQSRIGVLSFADHSLREMTERRPMLWPILILLALWPLGFTLKFAGGIIHLLLVAAAVLLLAQLLMGRKSATGPPP